MKICQLTYPKQLISTNNFDTNKREENNFITIPKLTILTDQWKFMGGDLLFIIIKHNFVQPFL